MKPEEINVAIADMKLDRNINPGGQGKYALVNLRKVNAVPCWENRRNQIEEAIETLRKAGVLSFGNESPGDQFFVMKHKDKFTASGLAGYLAAVQSEVARLYGKSLTTTADIGMFRDSMKKQCNELVEYAEELEREEKKAREIGNRLPD